MLIKKYKQHGLQRYYILSTVHALAEEEKEIKVVIMNIMKHHGCQVIVNGIFETLIYYLRLLNNTDNFITTYVKALEENTEINFEHKITWNKIIND